MKQSWGVSMCVCLYVSCKETIGRIRAGMSHIADTVNSLIPALQLVNCLAFYMSR